MSCPWFRYQDYALLAGPSTYNRKKGYNRRLIFAAVAIVFSILLNLYFILSAWFAWPSPLDNYQTLNTYPFIDQSAVLLPSPDSSSSDRAIVTTLYTEAFAPAVATLGHSLRRANTNARLILLYLPDRITPEALCIATSSGFVAQPVTRIPPPHNGAGVHRHFVDQFTKLSLWTLDQVGVKSLIYLDADTLVRRNIDELFNLPHNFAAVPDVYLDSRGFTLGFNAGVMFLRPSSDVFRTMVDEIAIANYKAEDAEQSFLNHFYGAEVVRLPFVYNGNLAIKKRTPKMWDGILPELRVVHYTMVKPFLGHDYAKVNVDDLDKHVVKMSGAKGGKYRQEVMWWGDMWKDTKKTYNRTLSTCRQPAS